MPDHQLRDRVVLITGASSGIGRETAVQMAKHGAAVVLAARRTEKLQELKEEIDHRFERNALIIPTDVRDRKQVESMIERVIDHHGKLDIVVNNAGIARGGSIESLTYDDYEVMMETNVDGTFHTTIAALSHLVASNGHLILMGSYAGKHLYGSNPVYGASRWWIRGFARCLQADVGNKIAVTVVNPSEVRTRVWKDTFESGEILEPEDVAATITFAAQQGQGTISEIDVFRRDKLYDPTGETY